MTKAALVTGAGRGIGAATALRLAQDGYAVCVNYAGREDKARAVVSAIEAAGGRAFALQADLGLEADILRLFGEIDARFGRLDALVNNAAVNPAGALDGLSFDSIQRCFAVNVVGLMTACREALSRMEEGGGIVNISSEAGKFGGNRMSAYAASKAAVNTFTVACAREAAGRGVRVNAVSPGVIATDAHAGAGAERLAGLAASIPMGRMGTPEEVAETIAWLLSDRACYVSGAVLSVTGAR